MRLIYLVTLITPLLVFKAHAGPADPDRPIPLALEKIPYKGIKTSSSSVSRGFSERNLFRMKAWRAWGSQPNDRVGAWISFNWGASRYLDTIHYVPGDERAPGYFDKMCSRPSVLEIQGDFETRTISLEDARGHQYITFNPPMVTGSLKFTIKRVRGKSQQGGVCFAAISFYAHEDPLETVPQLKQQVLSAIASLKKPLMKESALIRLVSFGSIISPLILTKIAESTGEVQRLYLESSTDILKPEELSLLKSLESKISSDNRSAYIRTLAALGDVKATQDLIDRVDELSPDEQASILLSVAKSKDQRQLGLLLSKYGQHSEVDRSLKEYIPRFSNAYKMTLALYRSTKGRRRAAYLELIAKIDARRALPIIQSALDQKDDPMHQSGAIRAAAYSNDPSLKMRVRKLHESMYVIVRRAVAFALSEWGLKEDGDLLKALARDRSMGVRTEALTALGRLGVAPKLLKSYAIYGSDEATAEAAAKSWMSGDARLTVTAPLQLLSSTFAGVRKSAIKAITDHQIEACPALIKEVLNVEPIYPEHLQVLSHLWRDCDNEFMTYTPAASLIEQLRALTIIKELNLPKMSALIKQLTKNDDPSIQEAIAQASVLLDQAEAESLILPYLKSDLTQVKCEAVKTLAHFKSKLSISEIKKGIRAGLKDPYQADRGWLLCTLEAAGKYNKGEFAPLLSEAYSAWSRSIGFVSYRLKAVESLAMTDQSPARLEALFKASTDLDQQVRKVALKALKNK